LKLVLINHQFPWILLLQVLYSFSQF